MTKEPGKCTKLIFGFIQKGFTYTYDMKNLFVALFALLLTASCQNAGTDSGSTAQQTAPGANMTTEETKAMAEQMGVPIAEAELIGFHNARINGTNVVMRKDATITSEKLSTFNDNEKISVLESKNVQNEGEAILSKSITVKGSGGTVTLTQGKAVVIEDYSPETNSYAVSYEDPKKGKLTAKIDASSAQTIIYATWFRVKRENDEMGWVLGKYVKTN